MIDLTEMVKGIRYGCERDFALAFFDHDKWVHEPRFFYLPDGTKYKPDFYDARRDVYIEVIGSRQAFYQNKDKYLAMRGAFPDVQLEFRFTDGSFVDPGQEMSIAKRRLLSIEAPAPMSTINEQAKVAVMALAEGSSISAVAKRLGIPQQTLSRFVTKPGASLSLKNFEKIAPYIEPTKRASGE